MWQKQVVKSSLWLSLKHQFETNYWMGKSSCWMTFCWCTGWTGGAVCLLLTVRVDRHRGGSWVASRASHELKQMPREVQFFHWISGRIIFPSVLTWIISFTLVRLFKKTKKQSKENLTYSVPTEGPNEWLKIIIPSTEQWLLIRCSLLTAWHMKWIVS